MADQSVAPEAQQHDDLQRALAEKEQALQQAQARLGAMEETFQALRPQPQQQPTHTPQGKPIIPAHLRAQIASQGLADAEIEANGALILPFLNAYLGQAAGEVLAMIQQQADEITMLKMLRNDREYPYAEDVMGEMMRIRESEGKAGRYVDPGTAYKIALANNYDSLERRGGGESGGQFNPRQQGPTAAPTSPQTTRSRDMSMGSSLRTVRAPVTAPERTPRTGEDLQGMSREERRAFFEQHGNTPIKAVG
jgi:uncharacterized coiled-coil protein SlyX